MQKRFDFNKSREFYYGTPIPRKAISAWIALFARSNIACFEKMPAAMASFRRSTADWIRWLVAWVTDGDEKALTKSGRRQEYCDRVIFRRWLTLLF